MRTFSGLILRMLGWKITGNIPPSVKKCVILAAPHTSNLDFLIGRLAYFELGVPVKFLIKKEAFENPLGGLLVKMGGIPVDRGRRNNLVEDVAGLFEKSHQLNVIVAPEGTRKLSVNWKKGFYYIALKANVPIVCGFVDYKKKEGGFGPMFTPSGDYDADFKIIETFYRSKTARHPELFSLSPKNEI